MSTEKNEVMQNKKVGSPLPSTWRGKGQTAPPRGKYQPFPPVSLPDRTWPDKQITRAPMWCSVDLRDGDQALATPMNGPEKLELYRTLVEVGFKEIEVGFPSASQVEFDFCRTLIEEELVPEDVTLQVLVQCREELIRRSFDALTGARRAIIHIYNSTNPAQRRLVFGKTREQIKAIAVESARLVRQLAQAHPETEWVLQYSPESFVLTELDFSLEICEAVCAQWQPTPERKIILNLPTTVESSTPNIHADQIEWFGRHITNRESVVLSLHTHNDRGTGVASTELALLAGAQRVEGTLFGNGERTGNLDVVTVALNLYSQGVDPELDFSQLPAIRETFERVTRMQVPARQPYAGDLVFTAFSGSHQDAINKGFAAQSRQDATGYSSSISDASNKGFEGHNPTGVWEVPYLPLDPHDIGRTYEAIIRYNRLSGKGGMAYILEQVYGFNLPKAMRVEFGTILNALADNLGIELVPSRIYEAFRDEYLKQEAPFRLMNFRASESDDEEELRVDCRAAVCYDGREIAIVGQGNGPIDAFVVGLGQSGIAQCDVTSYAEHSLASGAEAKAAAYIEIEVAGRQLFGAGVDTSIDKASIKAVLSALNRAARQSEGLLEKTAKNL